MTKPATVWKTQDGYDTATLGNEGFFPLLETGDFILLETSDKILLEPTVITPKSPTVWTEA